MRAYWVSVFAGVALLIPTRGSAQADRAPEPPPLVTAANAEWQMRGEPIFYASSFYWPTGPSIFFDPAVMVRTGHYEGVPLYVDPFLPVYSVVYVPVGNNLVRPYVRRSAEAGRVGSLGAPSPNIALRAEPVVVASDESRGSRPVGEQPAPRPAATAGAVVPPTRSAGGTPPGHRAGGTSTAAISIRPPQGRNGVWLIFEGDRYYSSGAAVPFSPGRFAPVGVHRGFPVYRDQEGGTDAIFVASVQDGLLAPYRR